MSENSDNHIRFNSTNMVVFCKEYKDLEKNPGLACQDMRAARRFISSLESHCEELAAARPEVSLHDTTEIFTIDNFFSEEECQALIPVVRTDLSTGGVTNNGNTDAKIRTSQIHAFYDHTPARQKICDYLGLHPNFGEPMVGQIYSKDQEFKLHCDYFEDSRPLEFNHYARQQGGQRTWTFQVYLTDVEEGGETIFPKLDLSVKPKRGMALVWNNLLPDGMPNRDTNHASTPVTKGEKIIITQWFRAGVWSSPSTTKPTEVE